jgi:hypothetical protein
MKYAPKYFSIVNGIFYLKFQFFIADILESNSHSKIDKIFCSGMEPAYEF